MFLSSTGQSECSSPPLLERQDLDVEVEEKPEAELTAAGPETWPDSPAGVASETTEKQTFACDQTTDRDLERVPGPGDAVTAGDGSDLDRGDEAAESECPRLESSNATSVIVMVQSSSEAAGDAVCSTAEESEEEAGGDDQSVTTTTAEHPGTVIMTDVTINSLTVTFKEATMAEGFFKGY